MSSSPLPSDPSPEDTPASSAQAREQALEAELAQMEREGLVSATLQQGKKIYQLTTFGQQLWSMLLEAGGDLAGRNIGGADIARALQQTREELGMREVSFKDPGIREVFLRHLFGPTN